jgi:hypothetical protein
MIEQTRSGYIKGPPFSMNSTISFLLNHFSAWGNICSQIHLQFSEWKLINCRILKMNFKIKPTRVYLVVNDVVNVSYEKLEGTRAT